MDETEPVYYDLTIIATDPETEIWLGDDDIGFVAKETGILNVSLLPGTYVVSFGLGTQRFPIELHGPTQIRQSDLAIHSNEIEREKLISKLRTRAKWKLPAGFKFDRNEIYDGRNLRFLASMILHIFDLWDVSPADRLALIGVQIHEGEPIPDSRDIHDRVGWLMAIHHHLYDLYPEYPENRWVHEKNAHLSGLTPLQVLKENNYEGFRQIIQLLENLIGQ